MNNDSCPCTPCTAHFHCPSCAALPANQSKCRHEAEEEARIEKQMKEKKLKQEAERADMVADGVREFFTSLEVDAHLLHLFTDAPLYSNAEADGSNPELSGY